MTTEAMAERARIVALLDKLANEADTGWLCAATIDYISSAIERGDHDTIAIPRLSGDQGAK